MATTVKIGSTYDDFVHLRIREQFISLLSEGNGCIFEGKRMFLNGPSFMFKIMVCPHLELNQKPLAPRMVALKTGIIVKKVILVSGKER